MTRRHANVKRAPAGPATRCAIYTRKSSDEELQQEFNSLDARKGRRPSFDSSAPGEVAEPLIGQLANTLRGSGLVVETGRFAAHMLVDSVNDGPICVLLDSRRVF